MNKTGLCVVLSLGITFTNFTTPAHSRSVVRVAPQSPTISKGLFPTDLLGLDTQIWSRDNKSGDRDALIKSIDNSLKFLNTKAAKKAYSRYPVPGFSRDRMYRSLVRFRQLVLTSETPSELQNAVKKEFLFYQSIGNDDKGTVVFTAYYEPIYQGSRQRTSEYRYPLYRLPSSFGDWSKPHPKRAELEGKNGLLGNKSRLSGAELVWLRDRLEAFLVQIQGSAQLELTDGSKMTVGYAGATDYPYTSVGKELAKDGKLRGGITLPVLIKFFQDNPAQMDEYIPRNNRFVFFKNSQGAPAQGVINVPVTPERSIATDRSLMPPGALALVHTNLPFFNSGGKIEQRSVSRYVLDQDTGSAIKGPGRVDYYMGTGKEAGDRAGVTGGPGKLYYLLLKE
ncbi:murein transglycosylase A [Merismopedia glauca]|uniref:peptidoglycan lytic exotransglycosylase n=1 Tax=Merismopedia glauca CCAP 1448/3 TaxID=1296344 RepID=A0A2T1BWR7_9CYAN|nr:murein transglycosylase A [Merismopedia glauca]PSB00364.1 murein transglycosylase [Merismopedia glauca CCAP 1448/3]